MADVLAGTRGSTPAPMADENVIEVRDLHVHFFTPLGVVTALNGVSFSIPRGKVLGVVGESGCGKSITGLGILQLVPHPGKIMSGEILFRGRAGNPVNLVDFERNSADIRTIRGKSISMIFQEPMTSLNPVYTIGNQIGEAILLHQTPDEKEARAQSIQILQRVGMPNPDRVVDQYPHELSGGMRQRAMIAMALSCHPDLLIADEPTTALDVTTEAQILDLIRELQSEIGMSIMYVTHNLGVVAQTCDEVAVMYLGRIVERANIDDTFYDPKHPYTTSLLRSIPRLGRHRKERLEVIRGSLPDPYSSISGCPFHPRCPSAIPGLCERVMPLQTTVEGKQDHTVRCHLYPGSIPNGASGPAAGATSASA